jgi:hypothetical protein
MVAPAMHEQAARTAIEALEDEIERLSLRRERCRKLSVAAKLAIAAGAVWLVLTLVGIAPFVPTLFFASIAAAIGGVVLLGSNATTWDETDARLRQAEAQRAALIGEIGMRVVDAGVTRVH